MPKYQDVRKDYERLCELHDNRCPDDMTGGWVEGDKLDELLRNPTKRKAADIYWSLIHYSFYAGWEGVGASRLDDPEVAEIYDKYGLEQ